MKSTFHFVLRPLLVMGAVIVFTFNVPMLSGCSSTDSTGGTGGKTKAVMSPTNTSTDSTGGTGGKTKILGSGSGGSATLELDALISKGSQITIIALPAGSGDTSGTGGKPKFLNPCLVSTLEDMPKGTRIVIRVRPPVPPSAEARK